MRRRSPIGQVSRLFLGRRGQARRVASETFRGQHGPYPRFKKGGVGRLREHRRGPGAEAGRNVSYLGSSCLLYPCRQRPSTEAACFGRRWRIPLRAGEVMPARGRSFRRLYGSMKPFGAPRIFIYKAVFALYNDLYNEWREISAVELCQNPTLPPTQPLRKATAGSSLGRNWKIAPGKR